MCCRIGTASAFANFATQMTTAPSTQATALCSNSALPSQVLYNKEATGTGYSTGGGSYSSSNSNSNISIHIGPGGEGGVSSSSSEDCALYLLGVLTQMHPQPLHAPLRASLERLRDQYLQNVAPPARLRLPPQVSASEWCGVVRRGSSWPQVYMLICIAYVPQTNMLLRYLSSMPVLRCHLLNVCNFSIYFLLICSLYRFFCSS